MRLCVAVPGFFKNDDFCTAIRKIGALGFDAAETYNWKELDLDAVRAVCEETGVELMSICTSCFELTSPESSPVCIELDQIKATHRITSIEQIATNIYLFILALPEPY